MTVAIHLRILVTLRKNIRVSEQGWSVAFLPLTPEPDAHLLPGHGICFSMSQVYRVVRRNLEQDLPPEPPPSSTTGPITNLFSSLLCLSVLLIKSYCFSVWKNDNGGRLWHSSVQLGWCRENEQELIVYSLSEHKILGGTQ